MAEQQTLGKHLGYIAEPDQCPRKAQKVEISLGIFTEERGELCDDCEHLKTCELVQWFQYCNKASCEKCHLNGLCLRGCNKCPSPGNCLKEKCGFWNHSKNCTYSKPIRKRYDQEAED